MTAARMLGRADSSFVRDRQFMAATGAAARQHGTAVFSFHARAKPVFLGAFTIVRLKCAFRHK